ncbi:UTP--glucose-1-phosphate uridylyltransferase GalU [Candidatus Peregrinibacteria bacterium]|nr:UTP--glucose-1-phosphate uridylyltransferase GalU [Candidatus Peregrinibacteria bacterium]
MVQKIRKAVFPAAGYGTRFLPATKAQPKEMLPIVDKPVIQYLVEEAVASGIEEIIIVTGRGKRAIEDHFDHSFELEQTLVEKNKLELLHKVREVSELAKFVYVRQPMPLGDGHAVLCAKEVVGDEPFAVLFGDDIVDGKIPALKQLISVFEKTNSSVIGLATVPKEQTDKYGIIKSSGHEGRTHAIESMIEKPKPENAPSNLAIIGKYICTPEIFKALENATPSKDKEIRLIDGFNELIKTQKIYGYELEGKRYDTGNTFGFIEATIDFALKRKELHEPLKNYIKGIDLE